MEYETMEPVYYTILALTLVFGLVLGFLVGRVLGGQEMLNIFTKDMIRTPNRLPDQNSNKGKSNNDEN